jgi:hypothetical protein
VNCGVCEIVIALELIKVTSSKRSINLITNPNPVCSHSYEYMWHYLLSYQKHSVANINQLSLFLVIVTHKCVAWASVSILQKVCYMLIMMYPIWCFRHQVSCNLVVVSTPHFLECMNWYESATVLALENPMCFNAQNNIFFMVSKGTYVWQLPLAYFLLENNVFKAGYASVFR